jgi:hypothetical protein
MGSPIQTINVIPMSRHENTHLQTTRFNVYILAYFPAEHGGCD